MRLAHRLFRPALVAPALTLAWLCFCPPSFQARAQSAPPAGDSGKTRPITVAEVIQMALTNNLDILITKYTPILDQFSLNGLYSAYDPAFSMSVTRDLNTQPSQFAYGIEFPPYITAMNNYSPNLSGMLPFGLNYQLSTPLNQQTTPFGQYSASPAITLSQPILKNFWIDNTRYQIQLSRKTLRSDQLSLRLQIETTVNSVKTAYFNLIAARENVEVQRTAVQLAQELADENAKKVKLGALAPLDQRQAESQAASSQADLLAAQLAQAVQENTLKSLLALHLEEWRDVTPEPTETLLAVPETLDLTESLGRAIASRPEMLQAKIAVEKQHLAIKYTQNQLYPELDLKGSYGLNSSSALLGQAVDTIIHVTDPSYTYGVTLTFPLENTAARNAYKSAKSNLEQVLLQLKKVETTIVLAVDNDVKTVRSDLLRVEATRKAREYAEDALSAGKARLAAGSTTSFEVLQLQSSLTTARSAEIRALADYNIAVEQLALDEGSILERNHIDMIMP
ncbi:MAG: TolC family protein [Verrucomicrobiota bacterium]|jgi:outer membrane protein TolC